MIAPEPAPSSPVSGANIDNELQKQAPFALPENLSREGWKVLAVLARGLLELASTHLGDGRPEGCLTCHYPLNGESLTIGQLVADFLKAKARAGRSDRYLRALRVSLRSFAKGRSQTPAGSVNVSEIEAWLEAGGWAPRTQAGYLTDVSTMFNFAVRRGLVAHNPAAAVEPPQPGETPPSLHTPEQAAAVLEFARGYDLDVCRALAIRYFAGLRSSEADKLQEAMIGAEYIEVPARLAKTRRRRPVKIQPNLRAWLDLGGKLPLHDCNTTWQKFREALKVKEGLDWPHNVTRHSFCSYHLAKWQNAARTALEAGHTEAMLFSNYRERVTAEAAERFWSIFPRVETAAG